LKKSRQGIYLALRESGVDTSLGLRGKRREGNIVDKYLDGEWKGEEIGRSPTGIADRLGIEVRRVHSALKHRRNSIMALADKMPMEEVLIGGKIVDWNVDPYTLSANYQGYLAEGERKSITLSKLDMEMILRTMQEGSG